MGSIPIACSNGIPALQASPLMEVAPLASRTLLRVGRGLAGLSAERLHQPLRPADLRHAPEAAAQVPEAGHDGDQPPGGAGRGTAAARLDRPHLPQLRPGPRARAGDAQDADRRGAPASARGTACHAVRLVRRAGDAAALLHRRGPVLGAHWRLRLAQRVRAAGRARRRRLPRSSAAAGPGPAHPPADRPGPT
jgi:hypothetical protein